MAYMVMADIVMTHVVIAYVFMACQSAAAAAARHGCDTYSYGLYWHTIGILHYIVMAYIVIA